MKVHASNAFSPYHTHLNTHTTFRANRLHDEVQFRGDGILLPNQDVPYSLHITLRRNTEVQHCFDSAEHFCLKIKHRGEKIAPMP